MRAFFESILAMIFPQRCPFCGKVVQKGAEACAECAEKLPLVTGTICKTCGRGLKYCHCHGRRFQFERCVAPFYYEGPAKHGIMRLKFYGARMVAKSFGAYIADTVRREYAGELFDFVTAVPLSRGEMRKRGFNQSGVVAQALAENLGLNFYEALKKPGEIKPQRKCKGRVRWGNVFGAFKVCGDVCGKTILLVDDVETTGATLNECARVLRLAGAGRVYCAVIACVKK